MNIFSQTKQTRKKTRIEVHPEFGDINFTVSDTSRSLRLVVKPFQAIQVTLPSGLPIRKAMTFIEKKQDWIRKMLKQAQLTEKISQEYFSTQPKTALGEIRNLLLQRLNELAQHHHFLYNKVSVRNQKSRWGSCSGKNNISLNQKLFYLPDHLRDYILLHELAHTHEKNHSQKFWNILYNILGKQHTKQARKDLRNFDFLFYPPPETKHRSADSLSVKEI